MPPLQRILESILRAFSPTPEGWVFVGAIWLLAVIALGIALRQGLALKPERQELEKAHEHAPPHSTPADKMQSEVGKWRQTFNKSSLLAKYADVLWEIRQTAQPDLSAVLSTVSQQYAATLTFARLVPNLTMLVGLMGTVVGLAHVVQALGPQIITSSQANDPQRMAHDIAGQMGQLQTAFACTVNGIFAAVCVAIIVNFVERKQNALLAALDDFGVSVLTPRILPPAPMDVLVRTLQKSADLVEYITLTMSKATGEFTAQVKKFNEITSEANRSFEAIADDVNTSTVQLARSTGQLSESANLLGKLQTDMHNIYTNLVQKHETAEATFVSQTNSVIGKMDNLQTGFNTNTQGIIVQLQSASNNYAQSTTAFQEAGTNFRNMSKEIGDRAFDAVADRVQAIADAGKVYQQAAEGIDRGLRDVLAEVRDLMRRLDPSLFPREEWERTAFALDRVGKVAEQILKTPEAQETEQAMLTTLQGIHEEMQALRHLLTPSFVGPGAERNGREHHAAEEREKERSVTVPPDNSAEWWKEKEQEGRR